MLQFYFLSVLLNALAGYILFTGDEKGVLEFKGNLSLKDETVRFVIGILTALTGLLKLLSPVKGDVPVIGDLVPAIMGFLCGFALIFEYYRNRSSVEVTDRTERIDRILVSNKKIIGIAGIVAAILHFIFADVMLL